MGKLNNIILKAKLSINSTAGQEIDEYDIGIYLFKPKQEKI
jgi:hypothetical protein